MIEANGVELSTEAFGDPQDPPMLLIMGIGASMLWWEEGFCRMLSGGGRFVIRYDHRDTVGPQSRVTGISPAGACGVTSLLSVVRYKPFKVGTPITRPALAVALAVVSSAVVLAACGSSGKSGGGSGSATAPGAIKYADCMRAHGVQNFPDPGSADGGVQLSGSGINTQSPAFASAQSACQELLPGALPGRGGGSATRIAQGVRIAACIRAHGLRSFPDPATGPPSTPPAPDETILGGPYGTFSLSGSMFESPAFKRAAATCRFPLPGRAFTMPVAAGG